MGSTQVINDLFLQVELFIQQHLLLIIQEVNLKIEVLEARRKLFFFEGVATEIYMKDVAYKIIRLKYKTKGNIFST